jgi:hypothetical protein
MSIISKSDPKPSLKPKGTATTPAKNAAKPKPQFGSRAYTEAAQRKKAVAVKPPMMRTSRGRHAASVNPSCG